MHGVQIDSSVLLGCYTAHWSKPSPDVSNERVAILCQILRSVTHPGMYLIAVFVAALTPNKLGSKS